MKFNKILGAFNNMDQILEGVKNKVFKKKRCRGDCSYEMDSLCVMS